MTHEILVIPPLLSVYKTPSPKTLERFSLTYQELTNIIPALASEDTYEILIEAICRKMDDDGNISSQEPLFKFRNEDPNLKKLTGQELGSDGEPQNYTIIRQTNNPDVLVAYVGLGGRVDGISLSIAYSHDRDRLVEIIMQMLRGLSEFIEASRQQSKIVAPGLNGPI